MPIEVKGAEALAKFFAETPELGRQATRAGLVKSSGRLRTYIRRAAPQGSSGNLKKSIGAWVGKKGDPIARIGLKTRYFYATLEYGRKSYVHPKTGRTVKGSPQMQRFAFLWKAIRAHQTEFLQMTVDESARAFHVIAGKTAARMGAPVRMRRK